MRRIPSERDLALLQRQLDRLTDMLMLSSASMPGGWSPPVDVLEAPDRFLVRVDVPGLDASDLTVVLDDHALRLSGRKRSRSELDPGCRCHRVERGFGAFEVEVALPGRVDVGTTTATLRAGVLEVVLPRRSRPHPRTVDITEEET